MGPGAIRAFLTHLAVNRAVALATQHQVLNAIAFIYDGVVRREPGEFGEFDRAMQPKRLPTVLTRDDVKRARVHMAGIHGLMARLLYATCIRLMECVRLQIWGGDFTRGTITVRIDKGDKDRTIIRREMSRAIRELESSGSIMSWRTVCSGLSASFHEPLIPPKRFAVAQHAVASRRSDTGNARPTKRVLLTGLLFCKQSGHRHTTVRDRRCPLPHQGR